MVIVTRMMMITTMKLTRLLVTWTIITLPLWIQTRQKRRRKGTPVIDITNDEVNGDIVTPKEPISKPTPSLGVPDKKNEESSMDVPTALEYLAKVKANMNRPKKIKECIDHEMKMEEFLVEQFLNKSDVTKGPEIGLFVFLFSSFAYSVYVNLCG